MKRLLLCLPMYGRRIDVGVARRFFYAHSRLAQVDSVVSQCSLLAHGLNQQYASAITHDYDYFAILHSDVEPLELDWLDNLLVEMDGYDAAIVSAVVRLKTPTVQTSTALGDRADPWIARRLTLEEICDLPTTFTASDAGHDGPLLVNTGCMLVDLSGDWAKSAHFEIRDRIANGQAESIPEDWGFSRLAWEAGERVCATRAVRVWHHGDHRYPSWIEGRG